MKFYRLGLACTLPLLAACNDNNSPIKITSETVSQQQLDTIVTNIEKRYPEATQEQKQNAADVVVRAIENLVFVEGGSFEMGDFGAPCEIPSRTVKRMDWSPDAECLSSPFSQETGAAFLHKVTLDSYSIAKFETRFIDMEWMRQINGLPVAKDDAKDQSIIQRDSETYQWLITKMKDYPASAKAWQEAKDYCQWLGQVSAIPFDLPTEAQWEYAARSRGQKYYYATNNGYHQVLEDAYFDPEIDRYVEYTESGANTSTNTKEVDRYPPNPLGIYGMSNPVSEWVEDWYSPDYYEYSPELNPKGPKEGTEKVLRDAGGTTMTFSRIHSVPVKSTYFYSTSFRCALQQSVPATNK
ncbi:SUMF1/EgtB/PvdO family nonheme iron enzyme [Photobacterium sp. CAU 1568]|uniref:SUMF1/EgtB/PvdO family nonheme iron enzyme n=1 Tax=Photobacterium arenosum TaxID=2774143 RepID=A0ABR9BM71_9GAMM|nr:SUMF1/EgtB/PvdO family nonheme iron enzyme [Photobacterium arenosum]MBD8513660.1 SUMF1/EgtB/PvdO family nonheme iron enzyme [Photobacterium arenosum]